MITSIVIIVAMIVLVKYSARVGVIGYRSGGIVEYVTTAQAQTQAVTTPDLTIEAEWQAIETELAIATPFVIAESPSDALATAESQFDLGDRLESIQAAVDILTSGQPIDPDEYTEFILAAARVAAQSPIPFPFSGGFAPPDPDLNLEAFEDAVYSAELRAVCELDEPVNYALCARDAYIDYPIYTRALYALEAADAIPVARVALQSPNKLVVDQAAFVLCFHQDLASIPAIEARVAELDWPLPDMPMATSLLVCDDQGADDLALELLEGSQLLFDGLEGEAIRLFGRKP